VESQATLFRLEFQVSDQQVSDQQVSDQQVSDQTDLLIVKIINSMDLDHR
jgi:hypothetical protein